MSASKKTEVEVTETTSVEVVEKKRRFNVNPKVLAAGIAVGALVVVAVVIKTKSGKEVVETTEAIAES